MLVNDFRHQFLGNVSQEVQSSSSWFLGIPPQEEVQEDEGEAKGFSQGCPLSPFFACVVLHILLTDLNTELQQRAQSRLINHAFPGDNNLGSAAHTTSYLDDTNILLPYRDLSWFLPTPFYRTRKAPWYLSQPHQNQNPHLTHLRLTHSQPQHSTRPKTPPS